MGDAQILHFFGGKGGSGKTTLAAAFALNLSEKAPKEKVLLLSAESGRGLADLLKKKLSGKPAKLVPGKGEGGLFVAELDGKTGLDAFEKKLRAAAAQVVQKGAVVGAEDLQALLAFPEGSLEELHGLLQVSALLAKDGYDRVVLDCAPTAHVLRLLELPAQLRRYLQLAKAEKPVVKKTLAKEKEVAAAPAGPLDPFTQAIDALQALLKDPARTAFHITALAEPVSEAQTRTLFTQLRALGMPVSEIVLNQIEDHEGCPACQGRRGLQAPHARKLGQLDKAVPVALLGKREAPARGVDALKKLAKEWQAGKETKALEFSAAEGPPALVRAPSMPPIAAPPLPPTRLIFFVGQGGVGKSSCAAAAAVTLTEKEGPVLLISTDPAHSLSDVLQSRLTDTETQVKGTKGLYARELDAQGWFAALRKRIKEKSEKAFEAAGKGADAAYDRELLKGLLDAVPAGLDELAALAVLTDALVQERFKRIVVDPSPALQGVRVVELPEQVRGWFGAVLAVLVKYRTKGLGELADEIAHLLKHTKRFEDALATPSESRFVVVTRGEELAQVRTERLVEELKARKLQVERVLVNRVLPKSTCVKCENRRKNELTFAKAMEKKIGLPITVAPALGRHPAGLRELKAFRTAWYALSATAKIKAA